MTPTVGRTVQYTLSESDANEINRRRITGQSIAERIKAAIWPIGAQAHIGNEAVAGQVYPMVIVRVWGDAPTSAVNGQVLLDGNDVYWATSRTVGTQPGTWAWPVIARAS
jgi:hypothetical protein